MCARVHASRSSSPFYIVPARNFAGNGSAVELPADAGRPAVTLNRYVAATQLPRPESWREDVATASEVAPNDRPQLFAELAAGAASGWDYSSRWLEVDADEGAKDESTRRCTQDTSPLCTIRTSTILPVELNAILYRNERSLAQLHRLRARLLSGLASAPTGESAAEEAHSRRYESAAGARLAAMSTWQWDGASGQWLDVDLIRLRQLSSQSAASFMPLWAGSFTEEQAARAVASLSRSALLQPGGLATTTLATGQQWDWPNAWPPLQQMLVEGLMSCGVEGAAALADEVASRWLHSTLMGWQRDGVMHEKMDATRPGERGGGGEYTPQVGFGWSNGVVLWMLEQGFMPSSRRGSFAVGNQSRNEQ